MKKGVKELNYEQKRDCVPIGFVLICKYSAN